MVLDVQALATRCLMC